MAVPHQPLRHARTWPAGRNVSAVVAVALLILLPSGCSLGQGGADPAADFEEITAAIGTGGVKGVDVEIINDQLRVSVSTHGADGPQAWSISDGEVSATPSYE